MLKKFCSKASSIIVLIILLSINFVNSQTAKIQADKTNSTIPHQGKLKISSRNKFGQKQDSLHSKEIIEIDSLAKSFQMDYKIAFNICLNHNGDIVYLHFNANESNVYVNNFLLKIEQFIRKIEFEEITHKKECGVFVLNSKYSIENLYYRSY